jgi:hypothetical protein
MGHRASKHSPKVEAKVEAKVPAPLLKTSRELRAEWDAKCLARLEADKKIIADLADMLARSLYYLASNLAIPVTTAGPVKRFPSAGNDDNAINYDFLVTDFETHCRDEDDKARVREIARVYESQIAARAFERLEKLGYVCTAILAPSIKEDLAPQKDLSAARHCYTIDFGEWADGTRVVPGQSRGREIRESYANDTRATEERLQWLARTIADEMTAHLYLEVKTRNCVHETKSLDEMIDGFFDTFHIDPTGSIWAIELKKYHKERLLASIAKAVAVLGCELRSHYTHAPTCAHQDDAEGDAEKHPACVRRYYAHINNEYLEDDMES